MILLLVLPAAFIVAALRGGKWSRLSSLPLRWPALPILAFAAQTVVIYFPNPRRMGLLSLHVVILSVSYLAFSLFIWMNHRLPGMAIICLGLLLNLTVMLANGGYMPITPQAVERIGHASMVSVSGAGARVSSSKDVVLPKEETILWFLSDVFLLPPPFPIPTAFSVGDILVAAGVFLLVQYALVGSVSGRQTSRKRGTSSPIIFKGDRECRSKD